MLEHRLVMEKMIGRYLLPNEVVHHKDKNGKNNHPSNLQLFSENGEHLAYELLRQTPNWSPEGFEKMRQSRREYWSRQRAKKQAQTDPQEITLDDL